VSSEELTPVQTLEAFEAAAFRMSGVTRRLLAEYAALPVQSLRPNVFGASYNGATAQLAVEPGTREGVRAWAEALGAAVKARFYDTGPGVPVPFVYLRAPLDIDGVAVSIEASYEPGAEEIEGWRSDPRPEPGVGSDG
jgi:hypothetical protein